MSGFLDNNYTFSLTSHQFQENNIRNFGVAAALGVATRTISAAVSAGYSSGEDKMKKGNTSTRRVFMSGSFNVPKIEMYLDVTHSCASEEFTEAIKKALEPGADADKAKRLFNTLALFGHFVATRYVIGGKLTTSETKELKIEESADSKMDEFAWKVKAKVSVDVVAASVQGEASANREGKDRTQKAAGDEKETQSLVMNAIGGEGILVNDTTKWAVSLGRYHTWSVIEMSDLVPSINILPEDLACKCHELLKKWIDAKNIEDVLAPPSFFLLCNGYYDSYKAKPYYILKNNKTLQALALEEDDLHDGMSVAMEKEDSEISRQHWYFTPEGYIVHKKRKGMAEFALTYNSEAKIIEASLKGSADNQFWELLPTRHLLNLSSGKYLGLDNDNKFVLGEKDNKNEKQLWRTEAFGGERAQTFISLQWGQTNEVLTMMGAFVSSFDISQSSSENFMLMPRNFAGLDCQLWEYQDEKLLVSKGKNSAREHMYLCVQKGNNYISATKKPDKYDDSFYWRINDEGNLSSHTDRNKILGRNIDAAEASFLLQDADAATRKKQRWTMKQANGIPLQSSFIMRASPAAGERKVYYRNILDTELTIGKIEFETPITGFKWSVTQEQTTPKISLWVKNNDAWHVVGSNVLHYNAHTGYFPGIYDTAAIIGFDSIITGVEIKEHNKAIWFSLRIKDKNGKQQWLNQERSPEMGVRSFTHFATGEAEANANESIVAVEFCGPGSDAYGFKLFTTEVK